MNETRVWLIRHAASTAPAGIAPGVGDPGLSELGVTQARGLASRLSTAPLRAVWSSDSLRAMQTAEHIAAPHRLPVLSARALREIDFGAWAGRDLSELWLDDPAAARAWELDLRRTPGSFGESVDDLQRRVRAFWSAAFALAVAGDVAFVAHRGSLAALRSIITGSSFADCFALAMEVGACDALEVSARSLRGGGTRAAL
ncbi:MAG TPA: histidine phosphatase family protein [Candidatus Dormibacteraeota bacterium]|nr:histidine phosphatase family protein [Candidatus Dormibacteraeota bacterium]